MQTTDAERMLFNDLMIKTKSTKALLNSEARQGSKPGKQSNTGKLIQEGRWKIQSLKKTSK